MSEYKTIAIYPDTYNKLDKERKRKEKKEKRKVAFDEIIRDLLKK